MKGICTAMKDKTHLWVVIGQDAIDAIGKTDHLGIKVFPAQAKAQEFATYMRELHKCSFHVLPATFLRWEK
jgi:hypothetical protein